MDVGNVCRKCDSIYSDKRKEGCLKCSLDSSQELICNECNSPYYFK